MRPAPVSGSRWIRVMIVLGVGLFLVALIVSATLIPELRVLHFFQALIYVAILGLTWQNRPSGYGIGVIIPTAWNCLNLFVTHLFQKGAGQFWSLLRTGHVDEPVPMMVMLGCLAHFLLIAACIAGFLQMRPRRKQWLHFFAGGVLAAGYFALIIVTTAPR